MREFAHVLNTLDKQMLVLRGLQRLAKQRKKHWLTQQPCYYTKGQMIRKEEYLIRLYDRRIEQYKKAFQILNKKP